MTGKWLAGFMLMLSMPMLATASAVADLGGFDKRECKAFAEVFYRIADLRDAGAARGLAIDEGVTFLNSLQSTGSHVKHNYRPAVKRFAEHIYARRDFGPPIMYVHGLYHCALSRTAADDAALSRSLERLDVATRDCKTRHSEPAELGNCIQQTMEGEAGEAAAAER